MSDSSYKALSYRLSVAEHALGCKQDALLKAVRALDWIGRESDDPRIQLVARRWQFDALPANRNRELIGDPRD